MKELQDKLTKAYNIFSEIPVKGDYVEIMAEARKILREAYKMSLEKEVKELKEKTNG